MLQPAQPKLSPPGSRKHIAALDGVRGLAIVLVTFFRYREGPNPGWPAPFAEYLLDQGHFGVDLFFVLSGFLITGILFDAKEQGRYFRSFYLRRTLRIFPLYYTVLLVTLVLLPAVLPRGSSVFAERSPYGLWLWLYSANLAQCWYQDWVLGPFNHFWSLAIEEHFYLVWPLLIYFCTRTQGMVASAVCIVIGLVSKIVLLLIWPHSEVPAEVFTLCRLDALGVGAWLALAARGPQGLPWLERRCRLAILVGGICILAAILAKRFADLPSSLGQMIYFASFTPMAFVFGGLLILAICAAPGSLTASFWGQRWLQLAGKYSYGWYVFQGLIALDLRRYLPDETLLGWCSGSAYGACGLRILIGGGLSLLLALVSWHLLERPCLALRERFSGEPISPPREALP